MKKLTVEVPDEFHYAVKVKALAEKKTVSDVVRELLRKWLEEEGEEKKSS